MKLQIMVDKIEVEDLLTSTSNITYTLPPELSIVANKMYRLKIHTEIYEKFRI